MGRKRIPFTDLFSIWFRLPQTFSGRDYIPTNGHRKATVIRRMVEAGLIEKIKTDKLIGIYRKVDPVYFSPGTKALFTKWRKYYLGGV